MTHTPGPWTAPEGPFVGGSYVGTPEADICEMAQWPREHELEQWANARLIAAAPAMLEALEDIVVGCTVIVPQHMSDAVKNARAAIALAKGEQA